MSTCKICENKAGLSILLVRPSAIAVDEQFAPNLANKLLTHEAFSTAKGPATFALPQLQKSRYVLRMLRQGGYVYVFYPGRPPQLISHWQAFRVHNRGALVPEGSFVHGDEKADFNCGRKPTHPNDVRTLCVQLPNEKPETAGPVWIGFNMNWWSDEMRAKIQKNPGAAGMVCINPLEALGGVKHAFAADTSAIQNHVAEFALRSLDHGGAHHGYNLTEGGTPSATPFYGQPEDKTYRQAQGLVDIMRQQSAAHPLTKGKEFVLAIPDPVGLAADLNGIRIARDQVDKEVLSQSEDAWPMFTNMTLVGMKRAMEVAAATRARVEAAERAKGDAWTKISEQTWHRIRNETYYRENAFTWEAADGFDADGSRNGRLVGAVDMRRSTRVERRGEMLGAADWKTISRQIDEGARRKWQDGFNARLEVTANCLYAYERDWLDISKGKAMVAYFAQGFDPLASNNLTSPVQHGLIYAKESNLIHFPQPLSLATCSRDYLQTLLAKDITDQSSIALRAMFGNQQSVIDLVHQMLIGAWNRDNDNNMRDKTYDLLNGLLHTEGGKKYSWLATSLAALSTGQLTAIAAGAYTLLSGKATRPLVDPYLNKLLGLSMAETALQHALTAATNKGPLTMPVLLMHELPIQDALYGINSRALPASRADKHAVKGAKGNVVFVQIVTIDEALAIKNGKPLPPLQPGNAALEGASNGTRAGRSLSELRIKASGLGAPELTIGQIVAAHQRATERSLAIAHAETWTDGKLAVGGMAVQLFGLCMGWRDLQHKMQYGDEDARLMSQLGLADSAVGFFGAASELLHSANKKRLLFKAGETLANASKVLAILKVGAAFAGFAGGGLNAWMAANKADKSDVEGDLSAAAAYRQSMYFFIGNSGAGLLVLADAGAQLALKRWAKQRLALWIVGAMGAELIGTATVLTVVSGAGLVLLAGGIATMIWGVLSERNDVQRWAGRCHFGADTSGRYSSMAEELRAWDLAVTYKQMVAEENQRLNKRLGQP